MTLFDYIAIAIIAGSILVAMMRGLVAEVLSLGSWLIAFWCAKQFSPVVSAFLPGELSSEGLRLVAGFVAVFFLAWLATALLRVTLTGMLDSVGLGGVNRLFGAVFGLARGLVLVTALVLVGGERSAATTHVEECRALGAIRISGLIIKALVTGDAGR